jgi:hypothetical protein
MLLAYNCKDEGKGKAVCISDGSWRVGGGGWDGNVTVYLRVYTKVQSDSI